MLYMKNKTILRLDFNKIADGMELTYDECINFFSDGRRISFLLEKRISKFEGFKKAESESDPFDVIDTEGKKAEVRCLTKIINFRPSDQIGKGRKFNRDGFYNNKIKKIDYFIIADVNVEDLKKGIVHIFNIPAIDVWKMYEQGELGKNAQKQRSGFLKMMKNKKYYERV